MLAGYAQDEQLFPHTVYPLPSSFTRLAQAPSHRLPIAQPSSSVPHQLPGPSGSAAFAELTFVFLKGESKSKTQ